MSSCLINSLLLTNTDSYDWLVIPLTNSFIIIDNSLLFISRLLHFFLRKIPIWKYHEAGNTLIPTKKTPSSNGLYGSNRLPSPLRCSQRTILHGFIRCSITVLHLLFSKKLVCLGVVNNSASCLVLKTCCARTSKGWWKDLWFMVISLHWNSCPCGSWRHSS